jgi:hypothetical protein
LLGFNCRSEQSRYALFHAANGHDDIVAIVWLGCRLRRERDFKILRKVMQKRSNHKTDEQLTKAVAEKVFGWKSVRKYLGEMIGRKQDKAGAWRKAKVPNYGGDQRLAYAITSE